MQIVAVVITMKQISGRSLSVSPFLITSSIIRPEIWGLTINSATTTVDMTSPLIIGRRYFLRNDKYHLIGVIRTPSFPKCLLALKIALSPQN